MPVQGTKHRRMSVEQAVRVDFAPLKKAGVLSSGLEHLFAYHDFRFTATRTGDHILIRCEEPGVPAALVPLTYDEPGYGGRRWYLVCPICRGRCLSIYLTDQDWRCRRCAGLAYRSQRITPVRRAARKALKIRARLGDDGPIGGPLPRRPLGMKSSKYIRLLERLVVATAAHTDLMEARRAARRRGRQR